jgi:DNA-binding beta-propeller fold protein YncE
MERWMTRAAFVPMLAMAAGCSEKPETTTVVHEVEFTGVAYPNRRKPIEVPRAGMGIVVEGESDSLSLLSLGSGERFASIPVGRDPVTVDGPRHIAVGARERAVYILLSYPEIFGGGPHAAHLSGSDFGYVQKLALDDLRVLGEVSVNQHPSDIALSEDGGRLVVTHDNLQSAIENIEVPDALRSRLVVIDPSRFGDEPEEIQVCIAATGVALSRPSGATAIVACYGEDAIAVVELDRAEPTPVLISVGTQPGPPTEPVYGPSAVVLSPDGTTVAIASTLSRDIRFYDQERAQMRPEVVPVGAEPGVPAYGADGSALYVPTRDPDGVTIVDPQTFAVTKVRGFEAGECPSPEAVVSHDDKVAVVCQAGPGDPGQIVMVDATSLVTVASATVGFAPNAIGIVEAPQ